MDKPIAAIFDMDGVLVDTYRAHFRSWLEMAASEGLQFSEEEFAPTFGRTSREIIAHFWGQDRYDDAQIAELDRRKEAAFRRIIEDDFPAMPGAVDLLRALHAAGFRLAVGSSGPPENVQLVVDKLGARELFGAVVTGAGRYAGANPIRRSSCLPPNVLAWRRRGVRSSRIAPVGVAAANAAGMASVGLLSTGRTREDLAAAAPLSAP